MSIVICQFKGVSAKDFLKYYCMIVKFRFEQLVG